MGTATRAEAKLLKSAAKKIKEGREGDLTKAELDVQEQFRVGTDVVARAHRKRADELGLGQQFLEDVGEKREITFTNDDPKDPLKIRRVSRLYLAYEKREPPINADARRYEQSIHKLRNQNNWKTND